MSPSPTHPDDPEEQPPREEAPPPEDAIPAEESAVSSLAEGASRETPGRAELPPPAVAVTGRVPAAPPVSAVRPALLDRREPLYRACRGYRLRLEPPDLARLRELPGSKGKTDEELGETFFDGQAERIADSVAGDVPAGAELRVVVDPYSRQAFVALENSIRGILSF